MSEMHDHDQGEKPEVCSFCGTEIPEILAYCPQCGQETPHKKEPLTRGKPLTAGDRPGIVLILIYTVITGVRFVVMSCTQYLVLVNLFLVHVGGTNGTIEMPGLLLLLAVIGLPAGFGCLIASVGLWNLRRWGLTVARVLYFVALPYDLALILLARGQAITLVQGVIFALVDVAALVYLFRPGREAAFKN